MRNLILLLTRPWFLFAAGFLAILWLAWLVLFKWSAGAMVPARQNDLLRLVADKKFHKCDPLLSETYLDQWNFNKSDALLALKDLGNQFLALHIETVDSTVIIEGDTARTESTLKLTGSGSAVAQIIIGRSTRVKTPYIFHWQKESWTPWSWRLTKIENADLPDLEGYHPGDISRAMSGSLSR